MKLKNILILHQIVLITKKNFSYLLGLQVCQLQLVVKFPGKNGAHIGIASDVEINEEGKKI